MKMTFKFLLLAIFIFLTSFNSFAQETELPKIENDTLYTLSGYKIYEGQDLKLGSGSLPNGDFKYITISTTSWLTAGAPSQGAVGRKWNGHLFKVKKFRKEGTKKRGFTYYLILGGGNIVNYECDIESAIAFGEVVVPEKYRPNKSNGTVVEIKHELSIGDELAKLKKLLDDGVLTKEEYDALKKKLLSK
ncbi:SHOCT domain-containing protein [Cytophagaceae bacterium 50C-KIRBA]|uniref:SHOCT domain-containing protein n=1 Tax=Aquirufa beregesia TaxID=2516556 RepID=A0ABX0EXM1_9BACT|nr:SHOCT domain-containing protein [Aquirufa beregesia]NGZ45199.1 SHOCT domain-containing protein [Aquirufa beregesia]